MKIYKGSDPQCEYCTSICALVFTCKSRFSHDVAHICNYSKCLILAQKCMFVCLFGLRLYVTVNNFSVISGRSHHFLVITSTFWEVNVSCSRIQHGDPQKCMRIQVNTTTHKHYYPHPSNKQILVCGYKCLVHYLRELLTTRW